MSRYPFTIPTRTRYLRRYAVAAIVAADLAVVGLLVWGAWRLFGASK